MLPFADDSIQFRDIHGPRDHKTLMICERLYIRVRIYKLRSNYYMEFDTLCSEKKYQWFSYKDTLVIRFFI